MGSEHLAMLEALAKLLDRLLQDPPAWFDTSVDRHKLLLLVAWLASEYNGYARVGRIVFDGGKMAVQRSKRTCGEAELDHVAVAECAEHLDSAAGEGPCDIPLTPSKRLRPSEAASGDCPDPPAGGRGSSNHANLGNRKERKVANRSRRRRRNSSRAAASALAAALQQKSQHQQGARVQAMLDLPSDECGPNRAAREWAILAKAAKLLPTTYDNVAALASAAAPSQFYQLKELLDQGLCSMYQMATAMDLPQGNDDTIDDLGRHARRCLTMTANASLYTFHAMLSELRFCLTVNRVRRRNGLTNNRSVYRLRKEYDDSTACYQRYNRWYNEGCRWALLASAGGITILLLLALLRMKEHVRCLHVLEVQELAEALMDPTLYPQMDDMIHIVIPFLVDLGKRINIPFGGRVWGIDLDDDALVLQDITYWCFSLPPRSHHWSAWDASAQTSLFSGLGLKLPFPDKEGKYPAVKREVFSSFNPLSTKNTARPLLGEEWTKQQRCQADVDLFYGDLEYLGEEMSSRYDSNGNATCGYLRLDPKRLVDPGEDLIIRNADGSVLACVLSTDMFTPKEKELLYLKSLSLIRPELVPRNCEVQAADDTQQAMQTVHYGTGNRYSQQGYDAPTDIPVCLLAGNHRQRIPRTSAESRLDYAFLDGISTSLEGYMNLIANRVEHYMPNKNGRLQTYLEILPLGGDHTFGPFANMVLNIGACSGAHRDPDMEDLCVAIALGDFTGGQLCLYEPRLVFNLVPGSIIVFCSKNITHFNMPFVGERSSIILYSENAGASWVKDFNGWSGHLH